MAALWAIWYLGAYVREQREDDIVLKETVGDEKYRYVREGGHLLRLRCGEGVDFDGVGQKNEWGEPLVYCMDCRFWTAEWDSEALEWKNQETVLLVEDIDQDGHNEVVVRTRWPEKPYTIYDWGDDFKVREVNQIWPETVSPELEEKLLCIWERVP